MIVRFEGSRPLAEQLYDAFRAAILAGGLPPGSRLPSTRDAARANGVSRNVVVPAYERLVAEGLARAVTGSGTYVTDAPLERPAERAGSVAALEPPPLSAYGRRALAARPGNVEVDAPLPFNFRYGRIAADGALLEPWRRAVARAARSLPVEYGDPFGLPELREQIAAYARRNRGVDATAERIVITSGSQQALDLVARTLLDPGDWVLIEEPHYQGARQAFLAHGAVLVPRAVDREGMTLPTEDVRARLAYVTPSHQFPTGVVMTLGRRFELLAVAERAGAFVVEDDYDSEFRYEARPVPAVQGLDTRGRVIYVGTFSKVLFPALRLGFLVLPASLVEAFAAAKWLADRQSPSLEQAALARFMEDGGFERHLRRARARNASRRAALVAALEEELGDAVQTQGTNAGIHVLVWLHGVPPERQAALLAAARADGVGVYPASPYFLAPPERVGLLVGYAALDEPAIRVDVRRLARHVRAFGGAGGS